MDFTIEFTSGGNHGHQLKDALGGLTIGRLFNLNYVHTPYDYLDYFGIGYNHQVVEVKKRNSIYKNIIRVEGPLWSGIEDHTEFIEYFEKALPKNDKDTLVIFENALRIHPFQTIPWFQEGKLDRDVFSEIQQEISQNFDDQHSLSITKSNSPIEVAMHINRGTDYDREKFPHHFTSPFAVRYMFSMDYYENILIHIEKAYGKDNVKSRVYTEKENSEDILERFDGRKNTTVLIGSDREEKNYEQIHNIFKAFVEADILVCSNSSFSVMCAYFRKGKKTVYHPHLQLRYLPEPNYVKTDKDGNLSLELLQQEINAPLFDVSTTKAII